MVMFAAAIVFFVGFLAIVVDVSWYWVNQLKVQRAADAAALAGAVWLPDTPTSAVSVAIVRGRAERVCRRDIRLRHHERCDRRHRGGEPGA